MPTAPSLRFLSILLPAGLLLAFAACSSESDRPEGSLQATPDYPTTMAGSESFAGGLLTAQVTFGQSSRGGSRSGDGGGGEGSTRSGGGGGHHHGGGGMGMGGGTSGSGMGGGGMGSGSPPAGMGGEGDGPSGDAAPRRGPMGGGAPGIQLKLHLTNTSTTDAISCEVLDFKSSLGDFAVFPAKYQLAAGQAAVSETMTSQLGLTSAEIPVTVALRIGDNKETKVVMVRLLPVPEKKEPASVGK